ncbi:hypothetical protein SAMN06296386_11516 [Lachnospiraceae bacterium]|nr:hypothetical protein SAMN06296386_11516 [Lachnospiraceae bacterium]
MNSRKEVIMANLGRAKRFVRYNEGAELYSIGVTKFKQLAHEAKAVYKVDKIALVNTDKFEKYLETFAEY